MSNKNSICYYHHPDLGNFHYGAQHPMKPARLGCFIDLFFINFFLMGFKIVSKFFKNVRKYCLQL